MVTGPTAWQANTWLTYDVTSMVTTGGLVSLAIDTASRTSKTLASRETAKSPQLVIEDGTPSTTPTSTATATPPETGTAPVVAAAGDIACAPGYTSSQYCQQGR